jgi:hypothetical protein
LPWGYSRCHREVSNDPEPVEGRTARGHALGIEEAVNDFLLHHQRKDDSEFPAGTAVVPDGQFWLLRKASCLVAVYAIGPRSAIVTHRRSHEGGPGIEAQKAELKKAIAQAEREGCSSNREVGSAAALNGSSDDVKKRAAFVSSPATIPHANELTIDILAAVAEDEVRRISARTKGRSSGVQGARWTIRGIAKATPEPDRPSAQEGGESGGSRPSAQRR